MQSFKEFTIKVLEELHARTFEEIFCQKGTITPSKMALSKLNCNTKRGDVKKKSCDPHAKKPHLSDIYFV